MSTGALVVIVAAAVALAVGGVRTLTEGRFRGTHRLRRATEAATSAPETVETTWDHVTGSLPAATLGERATLLQFSSAFCAPCRATRRTLSELAAVVPGVEHLEVDAEQHLDLVRRLGILRTPTTLVLDASGHEVTRATGAPRKEQVVAALGAV